MQKQFSQAFPRLADMTPSLAPEPDDSIRERIRSGLLSVLLIGAPFVFLYWWSGVYVLVAAHVAASVCCLGLLVALTRVSRPKVVGETGIALLFSVLVFSCAMSGASTARRLRGS